MTMGEKNDSVYRFRALFYKDLCDLPWNGQILLNQIGGIVFISVFSFVPSEEQFISLSFLLALILSMLTLLMQGSLMVEEYEQGTIRRLKQAGMSLKELIFSKMLLTFLTTACILIIFCFLYGTGIMSSLKLLLLILPILMTILIIGTYIGMKAKNTVEVSLYSVPISILYFFVEGLLMNSTKEDMPWLAIFPNYHLHYGIEQIYSNMPFLFYLIIPAIWMSMIILLFVIWCKKKSA
ncbi:ABC transporter permease [Oceanobacillus timonensis]|uniref:ABC transporter permease n=1 Tax=Oceanobacillus timonensis TaxID=1926285 RepID=UPI0009BA4C8E|nr:ABC transporter permease [Oceanobacillus timonensis]